MFLLVLFFVVSIYVIDLVFVFLFLVLFTSGCFADIVLLTIALLIYILFLYFVIFCFCGYVLFLQITCRFFGLTLLCGFLPANLDEDVTQAGAGKACVCFGGEGFFVFNFSADISQIQFQICLYVNMLRTGCMLISAL